MVWIGLLTAFYSFLHNCSDDFLQMLFCIGMRLCALNVMKIYIWSCLVKKTLLFGMDFNLVMDKELARSVPGVVLSDSGKCLATSSGSR